MEWRQSCTTLSIAIITLPTTSISLIHVHRINLLQLMLMKWGTHLLKRLWKLCEVINLMRCPFTWFFPSLQEMQIQRVCVYNAMDITENWWSGIMINLKCYYDKKKFTSLFPSDFITVFVWHLTGKILRFKFYAKAVFFECKFRISQSAIVQVQNWPNGLQNAMCVYATRLICSNFRTLKHVLCMYNKQRLHVHAAILS